MLEVEVVPVVDIDEGIDDSFERYGEWLGPWREGDWLGFGTWDQGGLLTVVSALRAVVNRPVMTPWHTAAPSGECDEVGPASHEQGLRLVQ
jgi:hypothetical protein